MGWGVVEGMLRSCLWQCKLSRCDKHIPCFSVPGCCRIRNSLGTQQKPVYLCIIPVLMIESSSGGQL